MAPSEDPRPDIFRSVLTLEEEFYKEGYQDGIKDGKEAGITEGKQFGIQTSFQRFRSVGVLQGRLNIWKANAEKLSEDAVKNKSMRNLKQLESYIADMPRTNGDADVEQFEKRWIKAKSKAKVVHLGSKDGTASVNLYDENLNMKPVEETIEDHTTSMTSAMISNLHQ